jgi:hypothetical protein
MLHPNIEVWTNDQKGALNNITLELIQLLKDCDTFLRIFIKDRIQKLLKLRKHFFLSSKM